MFLVPPVLLLVPLTMMLDGVLIDCLEALLPVSAWEQQAFAGMVAGTLPAVVATCIVAPVVEEMLFRGILLRSFLEQYPRGVWWSNLNRHNDRLFQT
jgi:membrane protease YdiL (CAAX protease family)